MDFATESVLVRRETKTTTVSVDGLRALALTAAKNAVDPDASATFVGQDAKVNTDGSITVSLSIETTQAEPIATVSAPTASVPPAPPVGSTPTI